MTHAPTSHPQTCDTHSGAEPVSRGEDRNGCYSSLKIVLYDDGWMLVGRSVWFAVPAAKVALGACALMDGF